jgi:hypothetical protein
MDFKLVSNEEANELKNNNAIELREAEVRDELLLQSMNADQDELLERRRQCQLSKQAEIEKAFKENNANIYIPPNTQKNESLPRHQESSEQSRHQESSEQSSTQSTTQSTTQTNAHNHSDSCCSSERKLSDKELYDRMSHVNRSLTGFTHEPRQPPLVNALFRISPSDREALLSTLYLKAKDTIKKSVPKDTQEEIVENLIFREADRLLEVYMAMN